MNPIDALLSLNKNNLRRKAAFRAMREAQKLRAVDNVPFQGVRVTAVDVRRHRYLQQRGLSHSPSMAKVFLKGDGL